MSAEVVRLATAWRRFPDGERIFPLADGDKAEEVEVIVGLRRSVWRYTKPCPEGASHWRPVSPLPSAAQPAT